VVRGTYEYSLRDLYPDIGTYMNTPEQTQPEEAEQVHLVSTDLGEVVQPKQAWSMVGVVIALVLVMVALGKV